MVRHIGSSGLNCSASEQAAAAKEALGVSMFPLDCSPLSPPTTRARSTTPQHEFERFHCSDSSRGATKNQHRLHLEPEVSDNYDTCCCLHDHTNLLPASGFPEHSNSKRTSRSSITSDLPHSHPSNRCCLRRDRHVSWRSHSCCTFNQRPKLNPIRPLRPTTTRRGKFQQASKAHRPSLLLVGTLFLCTAVLVSISDAISIDEKHLTNDSASKTLTDLKEQHLTEPIKPDKQDDRIESDLKDNLVKNPALEIRETVVSNSNLTSITGNHTADGIKKTSSTAEDEYEDEDKDKDELRSDNSEEDDSSIGNDDDDVEDCTSVSDCGPTEAKNLTDNDRLVKLQTFLKRTMNSRMKDAIRHGWVWHVVNKLSLSGGCMNSLMILSNGLTEVKSYAVKFLDASAKVPSGVMYGLLSDFGDFDECMSIKSNPLVAPEDEIDAGSFSGKYCLLSIRLNLHIKLDKNTTVPDGIDEDGVLWDDLLRHYWTTNSSKGFQIGVCVPSRCTNEDIDQLYRHVAENYNAVGEVMSCQDGSDLNKQTTPDLVQRIILFSFAVLLLLVIIGTLMDRYLLDGDYLYGYLNSGYASDCLLLTINLIASFSVIRNWTLFIQSNKCVDLATLRSSIRSRCYSSCINSGRSTNNNAYNMNRLQKDHSFVSRSSRESGSTSGVNSMANDDRNSVKQDPDGFTTEVSAEGAQLQNSNNNKQKVLDNSLHLTTDLDQDLFVKKLIPNETAQQLTVQTQTQAQPFTTYNVRTRWFNDLSPMSTMTPSRRHHQSSLKFLSGLRLFVIIWITVGHSFLYPSAHNYQYYRSIINLSVTKNSVWFATTNFTLGIDMILYITGLVLVYKLATSSRNQPAKTNWDRNCKIAAAADGLSSIVPPPGQQQQQTLIIRRTETRKLNLNFMELIKMIAQKIIRFWPTYLTVIALAIVIPLCSDGPMWPEMVAKRIGSTCHRNWWSNLLMINNFDPESELCLPSSWFISILMQLFLVGAIVIAIIGKLTSQMAIAIVTLLTIVSSAVSFKLAFDWQVRAPVIKMDETFVLEMDDKVFWLYTNLFNNMGPFLIGMLGGLFLIEAQCNKHKYWYSMIESGSGKTSQQSSISLATSLQSTCLNVIGHIFFAVIATCIALAVLSSTFFENYTPLWASAYWALHRIGWAIFTGYIIHNCALGRWKLLTDLLSLSTFEPISKLIFVAYLIYPILIHVHSGLVRDGLHVSIYNMMNIYVTRLVMTFAIALAIHLFVELPFSSIEEHFRQYRLPKRAQAKNNRPNQVRNKLQNCRAKECQIIMEDKSEPLLTIVPNHEKINK